jgi:hypothetical protein
MKKLRILLSVLAVVCAVTFVFAFTPQTAWFKPTLGPAEPCEITTPVDTDVQPCLVQAGILCKCGSRNAFQTKAAAEALDDSKLLKYN